MVIVMNMGTGRIEGEASGGYGEAYGDEVLNAGWADVPRIEARVETVAVAATVSERSDIEGFLARLYASQE